MQIEERKKKCCLLCRNHKENAPSKKNHVCPYESPDHGCLACDKTKKSRAAIAKNKKKEYEQKRLLFNKIQKIEDSDVPKGRIRKAQTCQKCSKHNVTVYLIRGQNHYKVCQYKNCPCLNCLEVDDFREVNRSNQKEKRQISYAQQRTATKQSTVVVETPEVSSWHDEPLPKPTTVEDFSPETLFESGKIPQIVKTPDLQQSVSLEKLPELNNGILDALPPAIKHQSEIDLFIENLLKTTDLSRLKKRVKTELTLAGLNTLSGSNWLNGDVINTYMELINLRSQEIPTLPRVYAMNSYFLVRLKSGNLPDVKKWTRKVDLSSKDIVLVPVHINGNHWCMVAINYREKLISYYDSFSKSEQSEKQEVVQILKRSLIDESDFSDWLTETDCPCPQQQNGNDCGVFCCMVAEYLSRGVALSFSQENMPRYRQDMVCEIASGQLFLRNDVPGEKTPNVEFPYL